MNIGVVEQLRRKEIDLIVVDTSAGTGRRRVAYHLSRARKFLRAAGVLISRRSHSAQSLYMPLEAGAGMLYNILLVAVARLSGFDIILHHHSSPHALSYSPRFALLAMACGKGAVHVALSERMAADLVARYDRIRQVVVCTNAVHVRGNPMSRRRRALGEPLAIGLLANLTAAKGLDTAINAVVAARSAGEEVGLVLAGPVTDAHAIALIEQARAQLGSAIRVIGPVSGRAKQDFYRQIDIFLFPTRYRYEAQPLVIYEALSFGVPILTTKTGYIDEMLINVGTALPLGDGLCEELACLLCAFAGDPEATSVASDSAYAEFTRAFMKSNKELAELCSLIARS